MSSHSPSPETPERSQTPASVSSAAAAQRSCATCRRRKVRCDKKCPCTPCSRGGHACSYPPKEPRAPRVRKATINDVATRISRLEETLTSIPGRQASHPHAHFLASPKTVIAGPHANPLSAAAAVGQETSPAAVGSPHPGGEILLEKGSSTQYFNEVLVSRVVGQESNVRTALATPRADDTSQAHVPSPFNPMGILSTPLSSHPPSSFHPSKYTAVQLWRVFVDNVDCFFKILHIPTSEVLVYTVINDPATASPEALALCYAVYYASTVALDEREDCPRLLGEPWLSALHRYKAGLEQSFAQADLLENPTVLLLQAMAIYLSAVRVHNTGRSVWTFNGLVIRIAQSIGLHRDGTKLGLSPFESEIRRRLWWYLLGRDGRAAEDLGLLDLPTPNVIMSGGAELPLNLEDGDLDPNMKDLPPPRKGWTRILSSLANIRICQTWADLLQLSWSNPSTPPPFEARDRIVAKLVETVETLIKECNPVIPMQRLTITTCRFIVRKLDFVTRQQWEAHHHPEQQELLATEETLLEALGLFEEGEHLLKDELLRPYTWSMRSYPQYHLMLFILWNICLRPRRSCALRAFRSVEKYVKVMEKTGTAVFRGPKWTIFKALMTRAAASIPWHGCEKGGHQLPMSEVPVSAGVDQGLGTGIMPGSTTRKFVEMNDAGMFEDMQHMPDWSTLLQGFLQEESNFSVMM
ncbi:C6 transcription factor, putative [Metarhizium acridum CQMa 102]|uniref:C6 transcription factor, putative n=1 Tax=Metarhizium acridum (strain CQMa 102) TaxID=655827 RepID=E9DUW1_METAQ|nr:C6 transcription factor, putative [Metarhizium acridum CQMa 102]EFY92528.1 C6 transcription factor, putative [Metarhizium acridum CQMa 102]